MSAGAEVVVAAGFLATVAALRHARAQSTVGRLRGRLVLVGEPMGDVERVADLVGAAGVVVDGAPAPPRWLARAVAEAGLPAGAAHRWPWWPGAVALAAVLGWAVRGPGAAAALAAVVAVAPVALLVARRGQAERDLERALPEVLEDVARILRSGASLPEAIAGAGDRAASVVAGDLATVASAVRQGIGLVPALEAWAQHRASPAVRLAAAALGLAAEAGGSQARAVDGIAQTLRARTALVGEVRALSSQARLSALVIGVAPVAFTGLTLTADPATASFLLDSSLGWLCLGGGLGLDLAGAWWMQRLSRIDP